MTTLDSDKNFLDVKAVRKGFPKCLDLDPALADPLTCHTLTVKGKPGTTGDYHRNQLITSLVPQTAQAHTYVLDTIHVHLTLVMKRGPA